MAILQSIREIPNPKPVKESHTCFVSLVAADGGGYHAAYREFTPFVPGVKHSDMYSCSVRYQKYDDDLNLVGDSHLLRKLLQDPRCFTWRGKPYATAIDDTTLGHSVYSNIIINLSTGESQRINSPMQYEGKNWMPAVVDDRLYVIRSLDPVCILECDEKWNCKIVVPTPELETTIGLYRGGAASPAVVGGKITGIGHKTVSFANHRPYRFSLDLGGQMNREDLAVRDLPESILDPTSIIDQGVVMCCSTLAWHLQETQIRTRICTVVDS